MREPPAPLELPPPPAFQALLRPPVTAVALLEVASCSRYNPDGLDELMSVAALLSAPREALPTATAALAAFAKRLLCWWGEWPADEAWDDEVVAYQDASWRADVGPGPYPPIAAEAAAAEAEWVLAAIARTRARAGRETSRTWPEAPLEVAWALQHGRSDELLLARTAARWTAFAWSTSA